MEEKFDLTKIGGRIAWARDRLNLTQEDLATPLGITAQAVAQWERKIKPTEPARKHMSTLAAILDVRIDWLLTGKGMATETVTEAAELEEPQTEVEAKRVPGSDIFGERDLPVYGSAEGGNGAIIVTQEPVAYTRRLVDLMWVKDAYGLIVTGDSMSPAYEPGDILHVHPHRVPRAGDDIVLYTDYEGPGQRCVVKRLVRTTATKWHLMQWNPRKEFTLDRVKWYICHVVVGKNNR